MKWILFVFISLFFTGCSMYKPDKTITYAKFPPLEYNDRYKYAKTNFSIQNFYPETKDCIPIQQNIYLIFIIYQKGI